jgi:hypothetical protein
VQEQEITPIIPFDRRRYWNDFQKENRRSGCTLIQFLPTGNNSPSWHLFIDQSSYKTLITAKIAKNLKVIDYNEKDFEGNRDLKYLFDTLFIASNNFWNVLRKSIDLKGFFIPITEVVELPKSQLSTTVNLLRLKARHFPIVDWLQQVKEETLRNEYNKVPVPVIGGWFYFQYYLNFIKRIAEESPVVFQQAKPLLVSKALSKDFEQKLPSAQLICLMMGACESYHLNRKESPFLDRFLQKAHDSVQGHWKNCGDSYLYYIYHGFGGLALPKDILTAQILKDQFYDFFENDLSIIQMQTVLDSEEGSEFWKQLPVDIQHQFGANRKVSLTKRMKNLIGNVSILDRIQLFSEEVVALPEPALIPPSLAWMKEDTLKWFDLSKEEYTLLSAMIDGHFKAEVMNDLQIISEKKQQQSYIDLLNSYTAPFFNWQNSEHGIIPQWTVLPTEQSEEAVQSFLKKQRTEKEAEDRLRRQLIELGSIKNVHALQKFHARTGENEFAFSHLQEQWVTALAQHKTLLNNTRSYRIRRMKEFGLLDKEEKPTSTTEALLDEMLQIEKEVTPYISFVKNAFKSALPMRKTTDFNPYRHSHDGIEFDPTTIQDQNKWLSGEVMKTLEVKIKKGDAIQINAFALDASGSMDHDRMRNLFKILYLLILGLEDRKTYDAIHFFSTDFMEAANFTDKFTDRKLLYKILKSISFVSREKGVVYGGFGGTNISAGLRECHKQVTELSEKLKKEKPDMLHLRSIFIITDGRPSLGITNLEELGEYIRVKRKEENVAIKGIYLKPPVDESKVNLNIYKHPGEPGWGFMDTIFGKDNFVETDDFGEAVRKFVYVMTLTFRRQRMETNAKK